MSSPLPSSSSSGKDGPRKRSKLRRTTISVLTHAYNLAADIAEERVDTHSTTGVAAGTAASLLSMGLEKVSTSGSAAVGSPHTGAGNPSILDIEADPFDSDMSYDDTFDSQSSSRRSSFSESSAAAGQDHFIDKLLEKLLVHAIPRKERENLSLKLHDPERIKKPNLSIRIMVKNFRKLSSRMNGLFDFQYGAVHIFTWKRPAVTLSVLVLYTSICIYPHFVLIIPLLYLLYGVMVPSYIYRHPLNRPKLKKVKKRGKSIFDFFISKEDSNILMKEAIQNAPLPLNSADTRMSNDSPSNPLTPTAEVSEPEKSQKSAKALKSQMELLINMRDLQNLTSDVINAYDQAERFWYGTGGFSDERVSTSLFISVLGLVCVVLFFGSYIPWRLIFIVSGWLVLILCHPVSIKFIHSLKKTSFAAQKKKIDKSIQKSEIKDIILDEPPEVRQVEIFELEEQGWTPSQWNPYCFTTDPFDESSKLKKQLPSGCSMINEVLPPSSWKFDEEKSWQVDQSVEWLIGRSDMRSLGDEGWVYDTEGDNVGRWRRRKWTRDCYRYARPARRPRH